EWLEKPDSQRLASRPGAVYWKSFRHSRFERGTSAGAWRAEAETLRPALCDGHDALVSICCLQRTLAAGHADRRRALPRTLGRPLVSPNEQRFPPKLFKNGRRRDLHPATSRRSPNHASSVFARQSRLRNRLRTEPSPRLVRHP